MVVADSDIRLEPAAYSDVLIQKEGENGDDSALLVKKMLQMSRDLVSVYDVETGHLSYKNRSLSLMLGYTTYGGQVDEKTVFQVLLHPDDLDTVSAQLDAMKSAADGVIMEMMYRVQHSSGLWRLFTEQQTVYKRAADGTVRQILRIARDVTEQHHASAQLQNDNAEKIAELEQAAAKLTLERQKMQSVSRFIGTTAHELRTPLTIINTSLYLLKKMTDPVKQAERLQIIENQVSQLSRLVSQMHTVMRLDSLSQPPENKALSLNMLLTKLEPEFGGTIAKKELGFQLNLADNMPNIFGDSELVLIALRNVLENAIQFTDNGTITLQTARYDGKAVVTITDSGAGIDPQDIDHIFERFYKIESGKRSSRISAGLGLAITRRVMELHGGEISVESQLDGGSTFRLVWPL